MRPTPEIDLAAIKRAAEVATKGPCVYYGVDHEFLALCDPATLLALVAAVEALEEAERLYSLTLLLANGPGCGAWINAARAVLSPFASRPEAPHG